jgi:hypothetical protein
MYVTIGTLQKKVKNLTLTVREFNKRIVIHMYLVKLSPFGINNRNKGQMLYFIIKSSLFCI